jgi:hypothetical protein
LYNPGVANGKEKTQRQTQLHRLVNIGKISPYDFFTGAAIAVEGEPDALQHPLFKGDSITLGHQAIDQVIKELSQTNPLQSEILIKRFGFDGEARSRNQICDELAENRGLLLDENAVRKAEAAALRTVRLRIGDRLRKLITSDNNT